MLDALREEAVSVITALDAHFTPREYELELRDSFWRAWLDGLGDEAAAVAARNGGGEGDHAINSAGATGGLCVCVE